jgi:hypothetical protein
MAPISKFDLLAELQQQFGLDYSIDKVVNIVNATLASVYQSVDLRLLISIVATVLSSTGF